jgi:hypothetical protein
MVKTHFSAGGIDLAMTRISHGQPPALKNPSGGHCYTTPRPALENSPLLEIMGEFASLGCELAFILGALEIVCEFASLGCELAFILD